MLRPRAPRRTRCARRCGRSPAASARSRCSGTTAGSTSRRSRAPSASARGTSRRCCSAPARRWRRPWVTTWTTWTTGTTWGRTSMPTVDERLAQLLGDAAVTPPDADVFGAIVRKRRQRHTRRVARYVSALVLLLVVLAGSVAWLTTDDGTEPAVAPTSRDAFAVRTRGDAWLGARPVEIAPDVGYVRGPLIRSGEDVALAAYDRNGAGFKVPPPSRVVRIDARGRVLGEVTLQGEILSLAD